MAQTESEGHSQPHPFTMLSPSFGQRVGWLLTAAGRARRRLWQAYSAPDDPGREVPLVAALDRLRGPSQRSKPAAKAVLADALFYLVGAGLRRGALADASRWIADLEQTLSDRSERIALRQDLLEHLEAAGLYDTYVIEAGRFVADRLVKVVAHAAQVIRIIRTLYERVSPGACVAVLTQANGILGRTQVVRAAMALCRCPPRFQSLQEAQSWVSQIAMPPKVRVSLLMDVDALLVRAREAEWASEWDTMASLCRQALELVPGHGPARYWLARAELHRPSDRAGEGLEGATVPQEPCWQRLLLQVRLYEDGTPASAGKALQVLDGSLGQADVLEKGLTLELLKRALVLGEEVDDALVASGAEVCERLESMAGKMAWTQLSIARREVQVDRRYEAAMSRLLHTPGMQNEPQARSLLSAARILVGWPSSQAEWGEAAAFEIVEHVMEWIFGPRRPERSGAETSQLWQGLEQVARHPLALRIPELGAAIGVVALAFRAYGGDRTAASDLAVVRPVPSAPPWVHWLFARTGLLLIEPRAVGPFLDGVGLDRFPVAWAADVWRRYYGRPGALALRAIEHVRKTISDLLGRLPPGESEWLRLLFGTRNRSFSSDLGDYYSKLDLDKLRESVGGQLSSDSTTVSRRSRAVQSIGVAFAELGALGAKACLEEADIEITYIQSSALVLSGHLDAAARLLDRLKDDLGRKGLLLEVFWKPQIQYALGIVLARMGNKKVQKVLEELLDGPKVAEARSQLALAAIRDGALGRAAKILEAGPADVPGVLYARALLAERQGDLMGASGLLTSSEAVLVFNASATSPYRSAARRLLAAVRERLGQWEEAERLHVENLVDDSCDALTRARLSRLRIRRAYSLAEGSAAGMTPREAEGLEPATDIAAFAGYRALYRLLTVEPAELDALRAEVEPLFDGQGGAAWRQALARRLLQANRAEDAAAVLDAPAGVDESHGLIRARAVLGAWRALTRSGKPFGKVSHKAIEKKAAELWAGRGSPKDKDEEIWREAEALLLEEARTGFVSRETLAQIARCRKALDGLPPDPNDAVLCRWQNVLRCAAEAESRAAGMPLSPESLAATARQDPWPFWGMCELWSSDPAARKATAESLLPLVVDGQVAWGEPHRDVLGALCAWSVGRNETYLEFYERLLPHLNKVPVDPRRLWLAAGHVWLWQGAWDDIIGGELPECVEDLSEPEARLLMGLAYARAALECKDPREALRNIRQSREMFSPLVAAAQTAETLEKPHAAQ